MDLNRALNEVINEDISTLWNNAHMGAASEAPRKDFVGFSTKDGYNFPYQHNAPPVFPPTDTQPEQTQSLPWPLQTINEDLTDSFVYLTAAYNKIETCLDQNAALSNNQRRQLEELKELSSKTLINIKTIGSELLVIAQLAGPLPPQSPGIS
jgi:hypothetical protein